MKENTAISLVHCRCECPCGDAVALPERVCRRCRADCHRAPPFTRPRDKEGFL